MKSNIKKLTLENNYYSNFFNSSNIRHNVKATSALKLYTLYSPPEHKNSQKKKIKVLLF